MRTFFIITAIAFSLVCSSQSADYYTQGLAAKSAKKFEEALENFKKATEQKPTDGEAWYEQGWCYNELSQHKEAIGALSKAKLYLKGAAKVFYESGYANDYLNNVEEAVNDYKKCIETDSLFAPAYRDIANIYFDVEKDYGAALKYYNSFARLGGEAEFSGKTWYRKGFCENDIDEFEDAIVSLKKSIALEPTYGPALKELGYAYYGTGKYDEALTELSKSLQYEQSNAAYYYTGLCYIAQKKKEKAQEIYKKLVEIKSPDAAVYLEKVNAMK